MLFAIIKNHKILILCMKIRYRLTPERNEISVELCKVKKRVEDRNRTRWILMIQISLQEKPTSRINTFLL